MLSPTQNRHARISPGDTTINHKRGTNDTKGTVKLINLKQTDNVMAKNEKDKQKNNSTHDTT